jgi:ribose transport system permease protein
MTMSDQTGRPGADTDRSEDPMANTTPPADPPADATPPERAASAVVTTGPARKNSPRADLARDRLQWFGSRYALVGVWILMAIIYGIVTPHNFLRISTAQAIFGSQSPLLFLSISALCTFVVGEFDLSFAGVMGLAATIIPVLAGLHHMNVALACLIAMASCIACGVVNAFFIVKLGVSSLIVTLGTASLYLGLAELLSNQNTVSVTNPHFAQIALHNFLGLPLSFWYGIVLCAVFAYLLKWTPVGRHIVFVGANREVARLAGINVNRIRVGSYISASVVAALAGIMLVATVGGFDPTASPSYLLPALAAVFLGTAVVMPGQFNPIGTLFGIYFLETGIIGLQLLGYSGWVQDAFYGAGLVAAVTVAHLVRNRTRVA